jgi:putative peptidoglycan lipid II flippase
VGVFGSSVAQVSLLLDTIIVSFLVTGSVSWLYYADRLMEFPLGVFSIALATVILPSLSRHHAEDSMDHFTGTLDWALRLVILLVSPAAVAMLVFAGPLTATTFGYGKFDAHDVQMASYALMAYSWGLLGFSLVKVLAPGYFARQDTKTPVRVGLIALGTNMAINAGIVLPAKAFGFPYPHILIATSTCISAAVNTTLLWTGLARIGVYKAQPGWGALVARVLLANAAMAGLLLWLGGDIQSWIAQSPWQRAGRLAVSVAAAGATYFAVLFLAGMRMRHLRNVAGA